MGVRKFVVHGGRRWHELDLSSGRVEGWGPVSFVRMRRGQLGVLSCARVLRALRALSDGGKRSAARDGPRLSQIRHLAHERPSKDRREHNVERYRKDHTTHTCCQHNSHCSTDANFNRILKPQTSSVAVQCSENVTTGVQADRIGSDEISIELHTNNKTQSKTIGDESEILRNKNHASERSKATDHVSERSKTKDHMSERSKSKDHVSERSKTKDHGSERSKTKDHGSERSKTKDHVSERSKTKNHVSEGSKTKDHVSERSKSKDHVSERSKNKDLGSERLRSKTLLGRKNATEDSISSEIHAVEHDAEGKNTSQRKTGPQSEPKQGIDKEKRRNQTSLSLSSDSEFEIRRKDELQRKKAVRTKPVKAIDTKKRRDLTTLSLSSDSESETSKSVLQRKKSLRSKSVDATDKEKRGNQTWESSSSESVFETRRKNKLQRKEDDRVETPEEQLCKELVVTEEDVALLRRFLLRDEEDVFGVRLELFDTDDKYKEHFFYRLNPLVNLERCPRIARILRARDHADCASLKKDFVTTLGLRSVADAGAARTRYRMRRSAASDVDKENISARRNAQADGILEEKKTNKRNNSSSRPKPAAKPAAAPGEGAPAHRGGEEKPGEGTREAASTKTAKRSCGAAREYSAAEDAYIVRWVRGDGRAHRVNGNRLWAQLQPLHRAHTGRARSWQSLRNRYLRHLLPTLGARALPPHEAARLRAAAAHGELKARKPPPRRNSVFEPPRLRSAWGQRPRPPPDRDEEGSPEPRAPTPAPRAPTPAPRAPTPARTPPAAPRAHELFTSTPTYSALTKRFALTRRAAPRSDSAASSDAERRALRTRRASKRARSGSRGRPPKRRRTSPQGDKSAQDAKDSRGETTAANVKRSNKRSTSSDSDTVSPKPNKRPNSVGLRSGSGHTPLTGVTTNGRRRTRSQDSDSEWTVPGDHKHNRRGRLSEVHSSSTSSLSSVAEAPPSTRSRSSAMSAGKRPATRSERSVDGSERRLVRSRNGDTSARDDTHKHSGDQNGLLRSDAKSQKSDQRNRLRERNAQDSDKTRHRDRSARRDKSEVRSDERARRDHSERQKPRKRRLYNPNAF